MESHKHLSRLFWGNLPAMFRLDFFPVVLTVLTMKIQELCGQEEISRGTQIMA